jgi:hypothetical protein
MSRPALQAIDGPQLAPKLRPFGVVAKLEQSGARNPTDIGADEAAQCDNVSDAPRFRSQIEKFEFGGQRPDVHNVVVQSDHERLKPITRDTRHSGQNCRNGASDIQSAHQPVYLDADPTDHFRHATLRETPHQLDLRKPKMRVHKSKRDRKVVVGVSFDIRDLMVVPVDHHGLPEGKAVVGHHREPLSQRVYSPTPQRVA